MKSRTINLFDYLMRPMAFATIVFLAIPLQQSCSREKKKKRTEEKIGDRDKDGVVRYTHYPEAEQLKNLVVTYSNYVHGYSKMPKNWDDLSNLLDPEDRHHITNWREKFVVVWDISMKDYLEKQILVAYVKEAPEKGGWVAFTDTSVRDVTADEFSELIKK